MPLHWWRRCSAGPGSARSYRPATATGWRPTAAAGAPAPWSSPPAPAESRACPPLPPGFPATSCRSFRAATVGRRICRPAECSWSAVPRPGCSSPPRSRSRAARSPSRSAAIRGWCGATAAATSSPGWRRPGSARRAGRGWPTSLPRGASPRCSSRAAAPSTSRRSPPPESASSAGSRASRAGGSASATASPATAPPPTIGCTGRWRGSTRMSRPPASARRADPAAWRVPLLPLDAARSLDLKAEGIASVIWATGYRRDYGWLQVPGPRRRGRARPPRRHHRRARALRDRAQVPAPAQLELHRRGRPRRRGPGRRDRRPPRRPARRLKGAPWTPPSATMPSSSAPARPARPPRCSSPAPGRGCSWSSATAPAPTRSPPTR